MDLKYVQGELQKLSEIIDGWNTTQQVDALERDLALEKLRALYEVVRFGAAAEPAAADVVDAEPFADGMPVNIDLGEVLSIEPLPVSDAVGEPFAAAPTGFPTELADTGETAESQPAAEPEFSSAEADAPAAEPEAAAIFPASGVTATDETGSMPGTSPVTEPEPAENAAESFAGHADAPAPIVADADAPAPASVVAVVAEPAREDAPVEQPVGESESEASGAVAAFEPIPSSEPTLEPISALKPASEPTSKPAPAPAPASAPAPDPAPAPDAAPAVHQPVAAPQPIAPTLFGPEEETVRHRHKQRVIMSLYNNEPYAERPAPGKPAASERTVAGSSVAAPRPEASPSRHSVPSGQPAPIAAEPEPEPDLAAVAVPAAVDDDLSAVMEAPAVPVMQPADPAPGGVDDADEPDFEEITLEKASEKIPASNGGAVLGDVINHDVQTLADTIAPPRDMASELRRSEHVTDLRRAIGINDKFLMIRDLFGGDAAAYEAAVDKLNAFDDFDECMIHIAENYVWNANSDGAKFLMELLERKFA